MDLKILQEVLKCKSVPSINRVAGTDFKLEEHFVDTVKIKLIKEACAAYNSELCGSVEDAVISIVESHKYDKSQELLKNILYNYGYYIIPLDPKVIEEYCENDDNIPLLKENSSKIITEDVQQDNNINIQLDNIIDKIRMCPDHSSLNYLEEDFNNIGLTIAQTNNDRTMLCVIGDDNKPKNDKIFEDYIFIGSSKNNSQELSERLAECIIRFIKKKGSNSKKVNNGRDNIPITTPMPYGKAIGVSDTPVSESVEQSININDKSLQDIIDKISMCPDCFSLYCIEEDFNNVGLTIAQTNNNKVMLCIIGDDNKPKNDKIFEDYMFVGSSTNNEELSERLAECIIRFIKKNQSPPRKIDIKDKHWLQGLSFYGNALGLEQDRSLR